MNSSSGTNILVFVLLLAALAMVPACGDGGAPTVGPAAHGGAAGAAATAGSAQSAALSKPAPGAPTGVTAVPDDGQVTISWNPVDGASSYSISWSTTSGAVRTKGKKIGGARSPYTHGGLVNGTTYHYVVAAVIAGEDGADAPQVSATPQVPAPGPPTGVSAVPEDGRATLSWQPAAGAASYNIYWSTKGGVGIPSGTKISGAKSPYTHSGLANGMVYYYVVTALNAGGESRESPAVSVQPHDPVLDLPSGASEPPATGGQR